jgi:hypothetical protein
VGSIALYIPSRASGCLTGFQVGLVGCFLCPEDTPMRWPALWSCALSVAVTGCPEVHRPGGLADRAAHKDALELIPEGCSEEDYERFCPKGGEDSPECRKHCGEVR